MFDSILARLRSHRQALALRKRDGYVESLQRRGLIIGANVQFAADVFLDPSHCSLIRIGSNVTFAPNVRIIAHDASTKRYLGFTRIGLITIEDECFIGDSVIILPGVTIGRKSVVGAGSVVTRDVPPNSLATGNPAEVVCSLDAYLSKRRHQADRVGVFGTEYWGESITDDRRREMRAKLESGPGFVR